MRLEQFGVVKMRKNRPKLGNGIRRKLWLVLSVKLQKLRKLASQSHREAIQFYQNGRPQQDEVWLNSFFRLQGNADSCLDPCQVEERLH